MSNFPLPFGLPHKHSDIYVLLYVGQMVPYEASNKGGRRVTATTTPAFLTSSRGTTSASLMGLTVTRLGHPNLQPMLSLCLNEIKSVGAAVEWCRFVLSLSLTATHSTSQCTVCERPDLIERTQSHSQHARSCSEICLERLSSPNSTCLLCWQLDNKAKHPRNRRCRVFDHGYPYSR